MKKLLAFLLLLLIAITVGCSQDQEMSIHEVDISSIKNERFTLLLQAWEQKNGAYLFQYQQQGNKSDKDLYIFLNASNEVKDSKPTYFEGLSAKVEAGTLIIKYTEKETEQLYNDRNKVLYKIQMVEDIDRISIYRNEQETYFEVVGAL
jgi:hypothetical protein